MAEYSSTPHARGVRAQRFKRKYQSDQEFRLGHMMRTRFRNALMRADARKVGDFERDLLGCSVAELRSYLEAKFQPGMTWENWGRGPGKWQIDHIRPLCSFDLTVPEQQRKACHYTNLQPLWHDDHLRKTGRDINQRRRC